MGDGTGLVAVVPPSPRMARFLPTNSSSVSTPDSLSRAKGEWSLEENPDAGGNVKLPADVVLERTLKCLVIPGEDLLDIRALWRDVNELNCRIRYLGLPNPFPRFVTLMKLLRQTGN